MKPASLLRAKIDSGAIVKGFLATMELTPQMVEITQSVGADYLVADCEHHPWGAEVLADVCRAGRLAGLAIIIRVPAAEAVFVRQALDLGPAGIMLPCVDSVEQMDLVSDCMHVPPKGTRRPGGQSNLWLKNFTGEDWREEIERDFIVLPQIENIKGVRNADQIVRHPITTALALGPYDLALDLGIPFQWTRKSHLTATVSGLVQVADQAGKGTWCIGPTDLLREIGMRLLGLGEPTAMMQLAMRRAVEHAEAAPATRPPADSPAVESPYWSASTEARRGAEEGVLADSGEVRS